MRNRRLSGSRLLGAARAAAMAYDTRIENSGGGDFDTATSHKVMVNSRGFVGEFRRSYCGFSAAPIAQDEHGKMQRNYWYSSSRTTRKLASPEEIGVIAAQRALRRLGAETGEDAAGSGGVFAGDCAVDHREYV